MSLLLAGCASSPAPTPATPQLPVGRAFTSVSVTDHGKDRSLVSGTKIVMTFDDRLVAVTAGCNTTSGPARLDNGDLVVGDLATTAMACAPSLAAQDSWIADFVSGGPALTLSGKTLTLRDATTVITLTETPIPQTEGTPTATSKPSR